MGGGNDMGPHTSGETKIQLAIMRALRRVGFWVERTNAGEIAGVSLLSKGTPDLLLVAPVYGWLEVKTATGELNDNQRRWHARAKRQNVRVAVVRSVRDALTTAQKWRS